MYPFEKFILGRAAEIARRASLARARNPGCPSLVIGPLDGATVATAALAHNIKVP